MTIATSLWQASNRETLPLRRLEADLSADLVVIGGGFTGCAAALQAVESGASVVLLEAERVGFGGSGRNVGLVNAGLWLPPDTVIAQMGETAGRRLIEALGAGPAAVFQRVETYGIDCEATRNGTLHLAHAPAGLADLESRFRQGNRFGAPLQLLSPEETRARTGSAAFYGALLDPRAGTIQPRAYCTGLARAAAERGAVICQETPVKSLAHAGGIWSVRTAAGPVVRAPRLLLATNAYHAGITGGYAPQFVPVNYCQFATAPMSAAERARVLPGGEGCWDTALVMSSVRVDQAGRLIVGGMGDGAGPGGRIHAGWAARKLRSLYPELAHLRFEHQWSGRIAMTGDHVPKVVDFGPSAYACFGYSGRGISPGTVVGSAAASALLTGNREALPLPVVGDHRERLTAAKGAYYEFGATLTHAAGPYGVARGPGGA